MSAEPPVPELRELRTVEDYDRAIAELCAAREWHCALIEDPEQRAARRHRREAIAGRWLLSHPLEPRVLKALMAAAGPDEEWLWDGPLLVADGHTLPN